MTNSVSDKDKPSSRAVTKTPENLPLPSVKAGTNVLIADIVVRGASSLIRNAVEKRVATATVGQEEARKMIEQRSIIKTLGLYGVSKLATRSFPGLIVVSGGLLAKALYDRGTARQRRGIRKKTKN